MNSGYPTTRRLAALLLPALLLRAFIPVGFMPMAGAGGMSIVLCPGAAALPPGITHGGPSGHAPAHSGHGTGGAHGGSQEPGSAGHATCAFATGAGVFAAVLPAAEPAIPAASPPGERASAPSFVPAILRAQSPRAPPA
jgi:hypothetical protein